MNERYTFSLRSASQIVMLHFTDREASASVVAADSEARDPFAPGRLWSLWEMIQFKAGELFINITGLSNLSQGLQTGPTYALCIPDQNYENLKSKIEHVCLELERLGLPMSLSSANNLKNVIFNEAKSGQDIQNFHEKMTVFEPSPLGRYKHYSSDLVTRFMDEMSIKSAYILSTGSASYFNDVSIVFSVRALGAFSSAEIDMNEAAKCYALERYTASVFHSMRVLEVGLNELGKALGLTPAPNWNAALNEIEKEIRSRNMASQGISWKSDESFFTEAATHFRMVKNAWRNHTMHHKENYDQTRAKSVLNSVGDFMNHLSARLRDAP